MHEKAKHNRYGGCGLHTEDVFGIVMGVLCQNLLAGGLVDGQGLGVIFVRLFPGAFVHLLKGTCGCVVFCAT